MNGLNLHTGMKAREQQFTALYEEYSGSIRKLCMGYTGDAVLAQDLLQETFLRVWNNMERFRGDAKWSTWIYRIAVNTCLTHLRDNKHSFLDMEHPASERIQDENVNKEEQIALLYKCISQLEETDRLIITMVLEDKPYEEIADILSITENNLRVKIHRIKKQISEIYNSYERL